MNSAADFIFLPPRNSQLPTHAAQGKPCPAGSLILPWQHFPDRAIVHIHAINGGYGLRQRGTLRHTPSTLEDEKVTIPPLFFEFASDQINPPFFPTCNARHTRSMPHWIVDPTPGHCSPSEQASNSILNIKWRARASSARRSACSIRRAGKEEQSMSSII